MNEGHNRIAADPRIRALGERVARVADRIKIIGMTRVAEDLYAIAREFLEISNCPVLASHEEKRSDDR